MRVAALLLAGDLQDPWESVQIAGESTTSFAAELQS